MSIPVECPACEFVFSVPKTYAGKRGKCPECGNVFRAPAAGEISDDVVATAEAVTPLAPPPVPGRSGMNIPAPKRLAGRQQPPGKPPAPAPAPFDDEEPVPVAEIAPPAEEFAPVVVNPAADSASTIPKTQLWKLSGERQTAPRKRRNNSTIWIAAAAGAVLLVGGGIAIIAANSGDDPVATNGGGERQPPVTTDNSPAVDDSDNIVASPPPDLPKQGITQAELNELWQTMRHQVCKLEVTAAASDEPATNKLMGAGFVIDGRGWVATNYHLIRNAKSVNVVVHVSDKSYRVSLAAQGIIAKDPLHDVAILAVDFKDYPPTSLSLNSAATIQPENQVVSCIPGDGNWLRWSTSLGTLHTKNLPPTCLAAVRERNLNDTDDLMWIQHDLLIPSAGSGGPLLNRDGEVIGVSTSLAAFSANGYAIPIRHLATLKASASGDVTPFGEVDMVAVKPVDPPDPVIDPPVPAKPQPGSPESLAIIRDLRAACEKMNWLPKTISDYEQFQELAVYVTAAKETEENPDIAEDLRILIGSGGTEVMQALNQRDWPGDAELAEFNALAAESLKNDHSGIFAYVELVLATRESPALDGTPTIVCRLIGRDELVIIPVAKNYPQLIKRSRWLVLGTHDRSVEHQISIERKPEQPAALIQTKYLLGQPREKNPK